MGGRASRAANVVASVGKVRPAEQPSTQTIDSQEFIKSLQQLSLPINKRFSRNDLDDAKRNVEALSEHAIKAQSSRPLPSLRTTTQPEEAKLKGLLTGIQVQELFASSRREGSSVSALAEKYGIEFSTLEKILRYNSDFVTLTDHSGTNIAQWPAREEKR
mmetsp:Transcript_10938/g.17898  ORF Transcript_10938/g.17898 Transcript_10938/m.17898 type:complete len:160 (-) Transcript_10938:502-981(-)|eukprot:CAMPEP_0184648124 /NCGR_PEP_ID=MMETSP0308-20130426/5200_1 /TAXON_ID=38269 /ORGANISM="Gloeochaete witrockiana, Strain SAG 46.84" /LENGTH=159 /DNA_ID=CAMNT_0027079713 /DNA_START=52 /DNA_END=531 /DNA_ORIENTATION=-